jgi:tRNA(Leu) C34 or U34 (ribose-2'-O)-methylase TrmL
MDFLFTESMVHNVVLRNINDFMSQYHTPDYLPQEQGQKYYSKLIHTQNHSKNKYLLFGEKSTFNNLDFFQQNHKNVTFIIK